MVLLELSAALAMLAAVCSTDEHPYMDAWWPAGHIIGREHAFVHENYEFLPAIDAGDSYDPDFDTGLSIQHLVDAIERSDETDSWVDI